VSGHRCVFFFLSRYQTFDGDAYERRKMELGFIYYIQSAKPFLCDKPELFLTFFVVSVSKFKLGFTTTFFWLYVDRLTQERSLNLHKRNVKIHYCGRKKKRFERYH
jgi:hypothetical protein